MGDWLLPSARRRARAPRRWRGCCRSALRYSFFTASGAEAVEVACKLARSVTGRTGLRVRRARLPRPRRLLAGDGRPAALGPLPAADAGDRARALRRPRRRWSAAIGADTAAVIMETIPATGGYLDPAGRLLPGDAAPLRRARRAADPRRGAVRAGAHGPGLGASSTSASCPTSLITGKGTSAGVYPIAACCFGDRVEAHFARGPVLPPLELRGLGARARGWSRRWSSATRTRSCSTHVERDGRAAERRARRSSSTGIPTGSSAYRGLGLMLALDTRVRRAGLRAARSSASRTACWRSSPSTASRRSR